MPKPIRKTRTGQHKSGKILKPIRKTRTGQHISGKILKPIRKTRTGQNKSVKILKPMSGREIEKRPGQHEILTPENIFTFNDSKPMIRIL